MHTEKRVIRLGVLYSLTGSYGAIGREMLNGVLMAISQANSDPTFGFILEPVIRDPAGSLDQYYAMCHELLNEYRVHHVIGCYTSASRKRVLPLVEAANAMLWHSARYEGFESSANVIYVGAAPNQHVIPLMRHAVRHYDKSLYNVGSNYVWSWEINRIARETILANEGTLLGEKLVQLGDTDIQGIIDDIVLKRPAIVLNTLVGESAYHFYRAWEQAAKTHPFLASDAVAKLSLTLCEPEVKLVGASAVQGYLVSSVYFQSINSPENAHFLNTYRACFGTDGSPSVDTEAAFLCGVFLSRSIAACATDDVTAVRNAVYQQSVLAPQGVVHIDPENNHAYLTPRLAKCLANGQFEIFWESDDPVKPDPYLTWIDSADLSDVPRLPVAGRPLAAARTVASKS